VIRALEKIVGADHISYTEFLPSGEVSVVKSTPMDEAESRFFPAFQAHIHENPLAVPFFQGRLATARRISDVQPFTAYRRTGIYNEFYRPLDSDFQMACNVPARGGGSAGLAINRKRRDFSDEELFLFNLLMPHARQAHDICRSLAAASGVASAMSEALDSELYGVVCFADGYRAHLVSRHAEDLAWNLFQCRPLAGSVLPDRLLHCILRLRGSDGELPAPRRPLTFRLADGATVRLKLATDPEGINHCLLFERERLVSGPEQLASLGLTRRENEVVFWALRQKTNWEIGRILGISGRTAAKHIENIFAKLAVTSRAELQTKVRESCDIG
jgi:DNA-binding CsgD family transcriptional regulator